MKLAGNIKFKLANKNDFQYDKIKRKEIKFILSDIADKLLK